MRVNDSALEHHIDHLLRPGGDPSNDGATWARIALELALDLRECRQGLRQIGAHQDTRGPRPDAQMIAGARREMQIKKLRQVLHDYIHEIVNAENGFGAVVDEAIYLYGDNARLREMLEGALAMAESALLDAGSELPPAHRYHEHARAQYDRIAEIRRLSALTPIPKATIAVEKRADEASEKLAGKEA